MRKFIVQFFYLSIFTFVWYQAFLLFLKFAWGSKYFIVDDPRLWLLFFVALFFYDFIPPKQ